MCSNVHHLYPAVQSPGWFSLPAVASVESTIGPSVAASSDREDTYSSFRSSGVTLALSCEVGKAVEQRLTGAHSSPSAIVVSLNGSMLAWQWGWVQAYQKIPPFPIPQKYGGGLRGADVHLSGLADDTASGNRLQRWIHRREPPVPGFLRHLRAFKLAVKATAISVMFPQLSSHWGVFVCDPSVFCCVCCGRLTCVSRFRILLASARRCWADSVAV
jgi:hypothetical protein